MRLTDDVFDRMDGNAAIEIAKYYIYYRNNASVAKGQSLLTYLTNTNIYGK